MISTWMDIRSWAPGFSARSMGLPSEDPRACAGIPVEFECHERGTFLAAVSFRAYVIVDHAEPALLSHVVGIDQPEYPAGADGPLVVVLPGLRVPLQLQIARADGDVPPLGHVMGGERLRARVCGAAGISVERAAAPQRAMPLPGIPPSPSTCPRVPRAHINDSLSIIDRRSHRRAPGSRVPDCRARRVLPRSVTGPVQNQRTASGIDPVLEHVHAAASARHPLPARPPACPG